MALEVGRGGDEYQRVVLLGHAVQVAVEVYLVDIEMYAGEIGGVVAQTAEVFDTIIAPHVPADVVRVAHNNLGDRCCPATAADNRYLTTVVHIIIFLDRITYKDRITYEHIFINRSFC